MSSLPFDPDIKINMSLDEIILLTRGQVNYHLQGRYPRFLKKKKISSRRKIDMSTSSHSVPLLSSTNGVDIYVSKKSPLLSAENRRRITQAITNRVINSDILKNSKEIIPAEYKLVKTHYGVERVLVPAENYSSKPSQRNLSLPRKLNKTNDKSNASVLESSQDKPPPLIFAPIYSPYEEKELQETPMEVDISDDEIIALDNPSPKKRLEVIDIDIESSMPKDVLNAKKLYVGAHNSVPQTTVKTLNDRFTMLLKNFNFSFN